MYNLPNCTGAMNAVFWSILGPTKITSIVYDEWGSSWNKEIEKLNLDLDCRKSMNGKQNDRDIFWGHA